MRHHLLPPNRLEEAFQSTSNPFFLSLQGKAKKNAWQKVVDEGITTEAAKEKYVKKIEELKGKYGYDAAKVPETVGSS